VNDMAAILAIPTNTVKQRLFQSGIKPISNALLYEVSALEIIRNTTMGRPKKPKPETADKGKGAKKPAKGKK